MRPVGAPTTWVLSNHDVTRHATRFASPPGLGTQIATAGDLALGLRRACAATLLMRALPDSAYLYQGEELGLPASSPCRTRFARTRRSTGGRLPRRLPGAPPLVRRTDSAREAPGCPNPRTGVS